VYLLEIYNQSFYSPHPSSLFLFSVVKHRVTVSVSETVQSRLSRISTLLFPQIFMLSCRHTVYPNDHVV